MNDTPIHDDLARMYDLDPPGFLRSKVPDGPIGELFFDGRTGRGLTNAEYDEQKRRLLEHDGWPL